MSDLERLLASQGPWQGHGIDHHDQPFHGELRLEPLLGGRAVGLRFTATGIDGTLYQDAHGWIAPDAAGRLCLWTLHGGLPGVTAHARRHGAPAADADHTLVFGAGDPADRESYRAEVALDWLPDGTLVFRGAWGLPGGEYRPRSTVRLRPALAEPEPA